MKTLLVIIPDRLSVLIKKGEITARYYNPGNLFEEVHILLANNDQPDHTALQKTVGRAKLYLHNLPPPNFLLTGGYQPRLINKWVDEGIDIVQKISPSLVRVHNNFIEGYLAGKIKEKLGIPYIVSLHGVWDRDLTLRSARKWLFVLLTRKLQRYSTIRADHVIAVYKPIVRYAQSLGAKRVSLVYNVVASDIPSKKGYRLHSPPRLITINRQVQQKNPENIIRAIRDVDCEYLLIGDGPYHDYLVQIAKEEGISEKVKFIKAIPNEEICALLQEQDLMVSHVDYWGISKTIIEASLAGLPTIINRHPVEPIPEYSGGWVLLVDNTHAGYRNGILSLLGNPKLREAYGKKAKRHAKQNFDPTLMEENTVAIYRKTMETAREKKK